MSKNGTDLFHEINTIIQLVEDNINIKHKVRRVVMAESLQWKGLALPDQEVSKTLERLSQELNIDSLILQILHQRGIKEHAEILDFLDPKLAALPDPFLMSGMEQAVQILSQGLIHNEQVLVWGDYDADGVTGTAVLVDFLTGHGWQVRHHIPNRLCEGYGLNCHKLTELAQSMGPGNKILLTVDNGIAAHVEVEKANELGFQVIVTDHHQPPATPVAAGAILNPKQKHCSFPDKNLAGVGVAFYLVMGLRSHLIRSEFYQEQSPPNLKAILDLVAIGTVADMVPLVGVNRTLVKAGFEILRQAERPGVRALLEKAGLLETRINGEDISFGLAPRINAAGRMGQPLVALSLLLADNSAKARLLAMKLEDLNGLRREVGDQVQAEALNMCHAQIQDQPLVVIHGKFHLGVIGIVASKLAEQFNRPAIIFSEQKGVTGQVLVGSGRSIPGIDLHQALSECHTWMERFGGHSMAAGMTVALNDYDGFCKAMGEAINRQSAIDAPAQTMTIDAEIMTKELFTEKRLLDLQLLEPHGEGNPQPIFRDPGIMIREIRAVGSNKEHLQIAVDGCNGGKLLRGIGFRLGNQSTELCIDEPVSLIYTPTRNRFRGQESWEIRAIDISQSL